MIRPAKLSDIPGVLGLTQRCAADLSRQGIFQWNAHYPSREAFLTDLKRRELWVLEKDGGLAGTLVLSRTMDEVYRTVRWLCPTADNRYVHRLAVDPEFQRQGLARQLMDFAEGLARQEGAPSIRLDTFSRNLRNQRFYEARGYRRLEPIYLPAQSPHPFYCYELPLSSPDGPRTEP